MMKVRCSPRFNRGATEQFKSLPKGVPSGRERGVGPALSDLSGVGIILRHGDQVKLVAAVGLEPTTYGL